MRRARMNSTVRRLSVPGEVTVLVVAALATALIPVAVAAASALWCLGAAP